MSQKQLVHMSVPNHLGGDVAKSLSHIQSDAKLFASGNSRKKLPISFLVQQEKRELLRMGMQSHVNSKIRPDSAKVTYG